MTTKQKITILKRKYKKFKSLENKFKNLNMTYDEIRDALDKLNDLYIEIVNVRNSNVSKKIKIKKIKQLSKKHNIPISNKNIHKLLGNVQHGGNEEPRFNMFKPIQGVGNIASSYVPTGESINASENIENVVDMLPLNQLITYNPLYQKLIQNIDGLAVTDIFFPLYLFKQLMPGGFAAVNTLRLIMDHLQWFKSKIEPIVQLLIKHSDKIFKVAPVLLDIGTAAAGVLPGGGTAAAAVSLPVSIFNMFSGDLVDMLAGVMDVTGDSVSELTEILFYVSEKKFDLAFRKFTKFLSNNEILGHSLWDPDTLDIYFANTQNFNETSQELSLAGKDKLLPIVTELSHQLNNIESYLESTLQSLEETTLPEI